MLWACRVYARFRRGGVCQGLRELKELETRKLCNAKGPAPLSCMLSWSLQTHCIKYSATSGVSCMANAKLHLPTAHLGVVAWSFHLGLQKGGPFCTSNYPLRTSPKKP